MNLGGKRAVAVCLVAVRPRTTRQFAAFGLALASSASAWAGPPDAPDANDGRQSSTVAILTFTGDEALASDQRQQIGAALEERGYDSLDLDVSLPEVAARVGCDPSDEQCLAEIGQHLARTAGTSFAYFVWAELPRGGVGEVGVFDLGTGRFAVEVVVHISEQDLILPELLGEMVARRVHELRVPLPPPEEAELVELEQLEPISCDDPDVCCFPAHRPAEHQLPSEDPPADLRADFELWCRVEPRNDQRFEGPDLRPVCGLGPTFGYFRPRTWTSLSLTAAAAVGTGVLYGLAFGGQSAWSGSTTDRLEIGAHAMLASTAVLGTVLTLIIVRDRRQAKRFIETQSARP